MVGTCTNFHLSFYKLFRQLQMLRWIAHEKEKFLMTYTDIGTSFHQAHELQSQHIEFATTCEVRICILLFLLP